ncbi:P-loop NTPase fold protein [Kitasatospora sp. NPDC087861]|uniref:P-loop NTPase fold protein n=1 Tax=Kitasatospora sp. NPDC087861 TaxID=3364070 RepID=UPI00381A3B6F
MASPQFFNDDTVDGSPSRPDLLGRGTYSQHCVELLRRVRAQSDSSVLALIGPWGSGKSSVLEMTIDLLTATGTDPWLVAEVNPWLYPDLESLTAALFAEIRNALPKDKRWSKSRESLAEFGNSIAPLGSLASLVGVDAKPILQMVSKRIGGDTSATAAKRKVTEALRTADKPILVVMDDLDRLTPAELLLVFKLVRLVGRLPNVHYLLSYDEHTLLDVLRRSDLVGGEETRAREFLEKIVQVRLDLPAFRERDAVKLVERCLTEVLESHGKQLTSSDVSRFAEAYGGHLQTRLNTPRAIKRFMAQVDASLGSVAQDVDLVDFLLVTFLRTVEPGVYGLLKQHRGELTNTAYLPQSNNPAEKLDRWHRRVEKAGVAEKYVEGVLGLLAVMFTPVAQVLNTWTTSAASDPDRRHGVGSDDYFDRYTTFAVPDDDLSEAALSRALDQIASGLPGDEHNALVARLRDDTHRITRRIKQRLPLDTGVSADLLALLADEYGNVAGPVEAFGILRPTTAVQDTALHVLTGLPADERPGALTRMAQTADGTVLAVQTLRSAVYPPHMTPTGDLATDTSLAAWARTSRDNLSSLIPPHLTPAIREPANHITPLQRELLLAWRMLAPGQAKSWIHERLDDHDWDLLPLLARLTPPDLLRMGTSSSTVLGPVDLDRLDALVGLTRITSELAAEIEAAPPQLPLTTTLATPDLEQQHVLGALRRHRDQNPQPPAPHQSDPAHLNSNQPN